MKALAGLGLLLATAYVNGSSNLAIAQNADTGMRMPENTLLVAQLDARQVVGGSSSRATGTAAFLLDTVHHKMTYSLTYDALQAGPPRSIALSNFGKGKSGEVFRILCGKEAQPCPASTSATISGRFEPGGEPPFDNHLIGEFDSQRVYVEIIGGNGEREIRGQLAPNAAMVPVANYVAHLSAAKGRDSKGTGTAIMSEIHLPGGKVSVFYAATVAGISGPPVNAGFSFSEAPDVQRFTPRMALPKLQILSPRDSVTGGSLQGLFDVNSSDPDAFFARRILSSRHGELGIVITTSRFPDGELYGILVPVH